MAIFRIHTPPGRLLQSSLYPQSLHYITPVKCSQTSWTQNSVIVHTKTNLGSFDICQIPYLPAFSPTIDVCLCSAQCCSDSGKPLFCFLDSLQLPMGQMEHIPSEQPFLHIHFRITGGWWIGFWCLCIGEVPNVCSSNCPAMGYLVSVEHVFDETSQYIHNRGKLNSQIYKCLEQLIVYNFMIWSNGFLMVDWKRRWPVQDFSHPRSGCPGRGQPTYLILPGMA